MNRHASPRPPPHAVAAPAAPFRRVAHAPMFVLATQAGCTPKAPEAPAAAVPASGPASAPAAGSSAAGSAPASAARKLLPIWAPLPDELPTFTEPPAGPRAPDNAAFRVRIGESTLDEVKALTATFATGCANKSVRVAMQAAREAKARELDAAKAAGKGADAVTGASILMWRSPRETNPQVRWSCEDLDMARIADRPATPRPTLAETRLLYVFDSEKLPVRHASLQRTWPKDRATEGVADLRTTLADFEARFGAPTQRRGDVPPPPKKAGETVTLTPMQNFLYEWKFANLNVRLNAVNLPRGLMISEDVDVPLPIRASAGARTP